MSQLKKKAFPLRDCVWMPQESVPLQTNHKFVFRKVKIADVKRELSKLKRKKSTGMDNIPPSLLKDCSDVIARPLMHIINFSLSMAVFPTDWKYSKLISVYKSGSRNFLENYRPISVIPAAISKIIDKLVHKQLSSCSILGPLLFIIFFNDFCY